MSPWFPSATVSQALDDPFDSARGPSYLAPCVLSPTMVVDRIDRRWLAHVPCVLISNSSSDKRWWPSTRSIVTGSRPAGSCQCTSDNVIFLPLMGEDKGIRGDDRGSQSPRTRWFVQVLSKLATLVAWIYKPSIHFLIQTGHLNALTFVWPFQHDCVSPVGEESGGRLRITNALGVV